MNQKQTRLLKSILVVSPLLVGLIASINASAASTIGLVVATGFIIGSPIIALVGSVVQKSSQQSIHAQSLVILGFAVPAVIICGYELIVLFLAS